MRIFLEFLIIFVFLWSKLILHKQISWKKRVVRKKIHWVSNTPVKHVKHFSGQKSEKKTSKIILTSYQFFLWKCFSFSPGDPLSNSDLNYFSHLFMFLNLFFICEKSEKESYFFLLIETELGFNFAKTSHFLLIIYLFNSRVLTGILKTRIRKSPHSSLRASASNCCKTKRTIREYCENIIV